MDHVVSGKFGRPVPVSRPAPVAFGAFYELEYRSALTLATMLVGDPHKAADVAQEIFTTALRRWDKVSLYDRPDLWVRRAVINRSISERRRRVSESKVLSRLAAGHSETARVDAVGSALWQLVGTLPRRQAQAIALVYGDDLSVEDAARAMRCSSGAVKSHLHRGRTALATLWRPNDDQ